MYILPAAFLFCTVASVTQTAHGEVIGNDNLLAHLQVFFHSWSQTNHGGTGAHKTVSKWKKNRKSVDRNGHIIATLETSMSLVETLHEY